MENKKAFTLVELLVAIIMIAIIAIAGFTSFQYLSRFIIDSEIRLMAVNFASETMEELYWDGAIATTAGSIADPLPAGAIPAGVRDYTVDAGAGGNYIIVTTRVEWTY